MPTKITKMIQRIQSVYLLFVLIIAILGYLMPQTLYLSSTEELYLIEIIPYFTIWKIILSISCLLSIYSAISFKNRKKQFILNRFNILLNLILIGVLVYQTLNSSGESVISVKGVSVLVPVFSIVLLFLANKAIQRDENLVKSADRLR